MKKRLRNLSLLLVGAALGATSLFLVQHMPKSAISSAEAAGGVVSGPNKEAPDRYVYYPGTEELAQDEIRVIACGTGLPAARRGQAATCFLIEAGNGDRLPSTSSTKRRHVTVSTRVSVRPTMARSRWPPT